MDPKDAQRELDMLEWYRPQPGVIGEAVAETIEWRMGVLRAVLAEHNIDAATRLG
jgi:hypothetical protein